MKQPSFPGRQHGVAAVEFALVAAAFFTILIGVLEMGRLLFYWNTAVEATRLGARLAVVCDMNDESIRSRMRQLFPLIADNEANIRISYFPSLCTPDNCQEVTVALGGIPVRTFIPFVPLSLSLPSFATTLTRESMRSSFDSVSNPVCAGS